MQEKRMQIKDSQVKKNLNWHILRLLRINSLTRQELTDKLSNMYMGHWQVNEELVGSSLNRLESEGFIGYSDKYEITKKGSDALNKKERDIEQFYVRRISKEACAKYSMWGNVWLSALEFIVGFLSGSIGLIADAVHTGIDIVASAITWIGIKINKEAQSALLGGIILCGIGVFVAFESITKIFSLLRYTFRL